MAARRAPLGVDARHAPGHVPTSPARSPFLTSHVQFLSTCWFLKVREICKQAGSTAQHTARLRQAGGQHDLAGGPPGSGRQAGSMFKSSSGRASRPCSRSLGERRRRCQSCPVVPCLGWPHCPLPPSQRRRGAEAPLKPLGLLLAQGLVLPRPAGGPGASALGCWRTRGGGWLAVPPPTTSPVSAHLGGPGHKPAHSVFRGQAQLWPVNQAQAAREKQAGRMNTTTTAP